MTRTLSPTFIPRSQRPKAWGDRASTTARLAGARAIDQAVAQIDAQWGPARRANELKLDVERAMVRGAHDRDVRARYRNVALLVRPNIDEALQIVERNYHAEVRHNRQLARLYSHVNPARERHLSHARLFLRWYRRFGDKAVFPEIVETMTTSAHFQLQAAE